MNDRTSTLTKKRSEVENEVSDLDENTKKLAKLYSDYKRVERRYHDRGMFDYNAISNDEDEMMKIHDQINDLGGMQVANQASQEVSTHGKKLKENKADLESINKFIVHDAKFNKRKRQQISEWESSKAFDKLKDDPNVLARKKHLQQGASVGISGAQRKEEAGRVGRAVRGMTPNRKIKSMLAGQGVRGVAASALNRKVKGVADKQKANFDMKQMARSYGHKTSSADKLAGLNVDVSTFDREQGRSNLKFLTDQEIHEQTLKSNALNTAAKFGKKGFRDNIDTLIAVEENMYNKNKKEE